MRFNRSSNLNGLLRYSLTPAARPRRTSSSESRAVSMRMGVSCLRSRIARRNLNSVLLRQHIVEEDQVVDSSGGHLEGRLAVVSPIDEEGLLPETYLQEGSYL